MELQPFGDVILKLLHFALYERERALQRVIREASELEKNRCLPDYAWSLPYSPMRCIILLMPCCLAFEAQFHIENFEFAVTCKPHLMEISHEKKLNRQCSEGDIYRASRVAAAAISDVRFLLVGRGI